MIDTMCLLEQCWISASLRYGSEDLPAAPMSVDEQMLVILKSRGIQEIVSMHSKCIILLRSAVNDGLLLTEVSLST